MDLRMFYQKMRRIEAEITDHDVVVISRETADGGRAGVATEVPRGVAAKLIVEDRARLASPEEAAEYRAAVVERARKAEQLANANKLQVTLISEPELRALKSAIRPQKS
ncbi:MAG: hypothetical protein ABI165_01805 [Bryobacteraceae bacterium]